MNFLYQFYFTMRVTVSFFIRLFNSLLLSWFYFIYKMYGDLLVITVIVLLFYHFNFLFSSILDFFNFIFLIAYSVIVHHYFIPLFFFLFFLSLSFHLSIDSFIRLYFLWTSSTILTYLLAYVLTYLLFIRFRSNIFMSRLGRAHIKIVRSRKTDS